MALNNKPDFMTTIKEGIAKNGNGSETKKAMDWLFSKATTGLGKAVNPAYNAASILAPINRGILTKIAVDRHQLTVSPGDMFFFVYDAKWKKTLKYYDTFPLIFPLEFHKDRILGMNFHYLDPLSRAKLLNLLMETRTNDNYDETTKLKLSYQIVSGMSKLVQPTLHMYLLDHVKTKFIKIEPIEWHWTIFLPTEKFVDDRGRTRVAVSKGKVWNDSKKKFYK